MMSSMQRFQQESKAKNPAARTKEAKQVSASATTEAFVQQADGTWQYAGNVHTRNALHHVETKVSRDMKFAQDTNGEYHIVEHNDDVHADMDKNHNDDATCADADANPNHNVVHDDEVTLL